MFTINNPTEGDDPTTWPYKFMVYQYEQGAAGTIHLQGYVIFTSNKRMAAVKKMNARAHWELCKGTHEQAVAYCTKEDTRLLPPVTLGEYVAPRGQKLTSRLPDMCQAVMELRPMQDIVSADPATYVRNYRGIAALRTMFVKPRSWPTQIFTYWGPTGTGKSALARREAVNPYVKPPGSHWFDGYDYQEDVLFDDFHGGWFKMTELLNILDRYECVVQTKGGHVQFVPRRIFITSNHHPRDWYPDHIQNDALMRRLTQNGSEIIERTHSSTPILFDDE